MLSCHIFILFLALTPFQCHFVSGEGCEDPVKSTMSNYWETDYRIPSSTYAKHYDLYLHPDLQAETFSGRVSIFIESLVPRDFFLVHIKYLNVTETSLVSEDLGTELEIVEAFEYGPNEFWVVRLGENAPAGNYTLNLKFEGSLKNGILGFYKSEYIDENGVQRSIATSKFQPTYARRAFPCFDEPAFKSTFTITMVRPTEGYSAISNMPVEIELTNKPSPGLTEVIFQKSVPMVSYLAVFIVCDFVYIEKNTDVHKIPFRVYGTTRQKDRLSYALEVGTKVSDFYVDYFDVKYPLPKLDMAAIPDYSSGATEHWGLITYRETNLIYDSTESSSANKERVAEVIAHELAHQWFGNLMTLEWWNDLWLNEGFATYISYKGVKSAEPDWDTESAFLTDDLHGVLDLDATLSSHPIVVDVSTPDQINAVFDVISYSKGSSVIRMMENFLGTEDFKLGIHNFLVKYSFQNAITQNLFDELSAVSSKKLNVTKIMNTWTRQKGYPVLNLTKDGNAYKIQQERFLSDQDAYNKLDVASEFGYKWEVPVTYFSSNDPTVVQTWLHIDQPEIRVPIPTDAKWLKFNVGQYGYYRVNYPLEDWQTLSNVLQDNAQALSVSDRASLINDAFALAQGGRLPFSMALQMTQYLGTETSLTPWRVSSSELNSLMSVFYFTDVYPTLQKYMEQLVSPVYDSLGGWTDTGDDVTRSLRTFILQFACQAGMSRCLKEAGEKFKSWKETGLEVNVNHRQLVYSQGMAQVGDKDAWDWMLKLYINETNAQEKIKLMQGLASIKDPWILYRFIQLGKDIKVVREQDFFTLLSYISSNRVGEQVVWDFVRNEWDYLVTRFTLNDRLFGKLMPSITSRFATERRLSEMNQFFSEKPEAGAGEMYRQIALETVENNIKFIATYSSDIGSWLSTHTKP